MKRSTKIWIAVAAGALAAFVGALLLFIKLLNPPAEPPAPPALAGQAVPIQPYKIDFTKRYDLICTGIGSGPSGNGVLQYHNCKILGFTGAGSKAEGPQYSSYDRDTFDKWIVLELPDKRHAFLPPNAISAFEEAKVPTARKIAAKSVGAKTTQ